MAHVTQNPATQSLSSLSGIKVLFSRESSQSPFSVAAILFNLVELMVCLIFLSKARSYNILVLLEYLKIWGLKRKKRTLEIRMWPWQFLFSCFKIHLENVFLLPTHTGHYNTHKHISSFKAPLEYHKTRSCPVGKVCSLLLIHVAFQALLHDPVWVHFIIMRSTI